jgi:hypothetical protein
MECASNCAREEQDGIVTRGEAIRLGVHPDAASELVRVGLWRQTDVGFEIVAWPEMFPPSARRRRTESQREDDALRKAKQRLAAREFIVSAADGSKPVEHAAPDRPTVSSDHPVALVAMSRRDSVTFAVANPDNCLGDPSNDTLGPPVSTTAAAEPVRELTATPHVRGTQLTDIVTATNITDEELFGIGDEAGTNVALKDLNLKNKNNSSTPPPQPSSIRIEGAAPTNAKTGATSRRPAARRAASDAGLWLPFEAVQPKPAAPDMSAARGAALIFEATSIQHAPFAKKHRESCEWLSARPAKEWAIAKPVLAAEANKAKVRSMLTPEHIAGYWATHYSVGVAPQSRDALERERAQLKPMRSGFVGPSELPTEAQYAAERAAAAAGTWGARC